MSSETFAHSLDDLKQLACDALDYAKRQGASAAEAEVSEGVGFSLNVRQGQLETLEHQHDKGLALTVYLGQKSGSASTSDFSPAALRQTVEAALSIARFTADDPAAGLPDPSFLATGEVPDLDLFHPWAIPVDEAARLARQTEAAAFAADARIKNSEGAGFETRMSQFALANSHGFVGGWRSSRHDLSCCVIAEEGDGMQRDYWYSARRDAAQLASPEAIGQKAARRAVARLDPKPIASGRFPVLFDPAQAAGLLGHFVHAASGGALYRQASFLLDAWGQPLFPGFFQLSERPHLPGALASAPFDDEGVTTRDREVIDHGVLQGWFLSAYSARKLGLDPTGHAGGSHNLLVAPGKDDFDGLLRQMGRGLVVTELLGDGVNEVTGD
ncbi:MAG: metalloprotease PmbA, partial [Zoogloeaceae bacterium]|nr:metalloprotease PmbA [Zoogloeaceae bacterium]